MQIGGSQEKGEDRLFLGRISVFALKIEKPAGAIVLLTLRDGRRAEQIIVFTVRTEAGTANLVLFTVRSGKRF